MFETIILAAIASFFLISNNNAWQTFVSYLTSEEQYALSTEHQIFSFEDLDDYFNSNGLPPLCGLYSNPTGIRNKGRICLDNIHFSIGPI